MVFRVFGWFQFDAEMNTLRANQIKAWVSANQWAIISTSDWNSILVTENGSNSHFVISNVTKWTCVNKKSDNKYVFKIKLIFLLILLILNYE